MPVTLWGAMLGATFVARVACLCDLIGWLRVVRIFAPVTLWVARVSADAVWQGLRAAEDAMAAGGLGGHFGTGYFVPSHCYCFDCHEKQLTRTTIAIRHATFKAWL